MTVSALLVLAGVVLAILLAFRWWRALPALALPLFVGTVWGFGLASLVVSSLGSSTAFLGSIVVGNGVNPGILLLARHLEERRRGTPVPAAIAAAVAGTWRGTLAGAVAAAAGYASLTLTSFRGFRELGVIRGVRRPRLLGRHVLALAAAAGRARSRVDRAYPQHLRRGVAGSVRRHARAPRPPRPRAVAGPRGGGRAPRHAP